MSARFCFSLHVVLWLTHATISLAADCNRNGVEDADDIAALTSEDCNLSRIPDECEAPPVELGWAPADIFLRATPWRLSVADMNNDGHDDLIVPLRPNDGTSVVSVILGRGGGVFDEPIELVFEGLLVEVSMNDLDADGDIDFAATTTRSEVVLLKNDGSGQLATFGAFPTTQNAGPITTGDVNGDGVPDVIVVSRLRHVLSVHFNSGDGNLLEGVTYAAGRLLREPLVADLNGDDAGDLVCVNERSEDVSVLLNQGDGTFSDALSLPLGGKGLGVAAFDLDDDGDLDLSAGSDAELSIWINPGDAAFTTPAVILPIATRRLLSGDYDDDGRDDLLVEDVGDQLTHVLLNLGNGQFGPPATVFTNYDAVAPLDFDGDGDLDFAVMLRDFSMVSFQTQGDPGGLAVAFDSAITRIDQEPHHVALGDLDADGDLDVITTNGDNASVAVLLNDGSGAYGPPDVSRTHPQADREFIVRYDYVQTAHLNGDEHLDILTADPGQQALRLFPGNGDGTFGQFVDFPAAGQAVNFALVDIDDDGDIDSFATSSGRDEVIVHLNDGSGDLGEGTRFPARERPSGVTHGDFDADGDPDFAVANAQAAGVSVFINTNGGAAFERVDYPVDGNPTRITTADFDRDGDLDLAATMAEHMAILLNQGDGTFQVATTIFMRVITYSPTPTDVNGDGRIDLVTANEQDSTLSILLGNGDGTFRPPFRMDNAGAHGMRYVLSGDLDGDGDLDLLSANRGSLDMTVHLSRLDRRLAMADFTEEICTGLDFVRWSLATPNGGAVERALKYTMPARDDENLLPTVFQNIERFPLHQEFLQTAFPDRFPSLTLDDYNALTGRRATRDYYVGVINQLQRPQGQVFGFSVIVDSSSSEELLTLEEVRGVFERLGRSFQLEPLGYFPDSNAARERAAEWVDPGFPIYIEDAAPTIAYQPYTKAVGFGRVRILDPDDFETANETGQVSFQSILILEEAPRDIEGVVGGVITAQQQGELSHVAIRTARRGTPNAFVANAAEVFAPYDGKLVRLEVKQSTFDVRDATPEEAEAFWAANRPELSQLPSLDLDFLELSSLSEIGALDRTMPQEARFGGKATNLARLGRTLAGSEFEELVEVGFAIPVHYYIEFLQANRMPSALDPSREVTYEEHLSELFAADEFQSDSTVRFRALDDFRDFARDHGVVDAALVERIHARVAEIFPSTRTPVRFRSSSNVEDALEFNGAGLYESTGGCVDDDLDEDADGPSLCDPDKQNERGVERALKKVWTSIYTFRAFEERAFYGIPEAQVGMGILVSRAFPDELANGVAFTGNIANPLDRRYVVTAQVGEESVVSPDPGVLPEKDLLDVVDGEVRQIIRPIRGSTLLEPGEWVLSDEILEQIGRFLDFVDRSFPLDLGTHRREEVLLDLEFKLEPDGTLAFKQVRPFLLSEPPPPAPTFALEIPPGTVVCGVFGLAGIDRGPRDEYELKSQIRLRGGLVELPTRTDVFSANLFEEVRFGPQQEIAEALADGVFRVARINGPTATTYRFTYEQPYALADGRELLLRITSPLVFTAQGEESETPPRVLDEEYFTANPDREALQGTIDGAPLLAYGSCTYDNLPQFEIAAELADGSTLRLEERFLEQDSLFDTGPASLQRAEASLGGEGRVVTEYWNLVYSAFRHNTRVRYWVIFDSPVAVDGVAGPVHAMELQMAEPPDISEPSAAYLGENFVELARVGAAVEKRPLTALTPTFRRGDVTGDGALAVTDPLELLRYLFQKADAIACAKAADANDDGRLNIADAIDIVRVLFGGAVSLPTPFEECGEDPTPDALECGGFCP